MTIIRRVLLPDLIQSVEDMKRAGADRVDICFSSVEPFAELPLWVVDDDNVIYAAANSNEAAAAHQERLALIHPAKQFVLSGPQ